MEDLLDTIETLGRMKVLSTDMLHIAESYAALLESNAELLSKYDKLLDDQVRAAEVSTASLFKAIVGGPMEKATPKCQACDGRGWLFVEVSGLLYQEVQSCNACQRIKGDDAAQVVANGDNVWAATCMFCTNPKDEGALCAYCV